MSGALVVTGSARGIGAALAAHFLDSGRRVFGIDVAGAADELAGRSDYAHLVADVTDEETMDAALATVSAAGPVAAVFANAAVTDIEHRRVADLAYSTWQRVLRVNVDGAFVTGRAAARVLSAEGRGNIVFVTSSLALLDQALAGDAPYCTSKAAVEMFARVLARELAPAGVNVNTLYPSVKIDTGFFAHLEAGERALPEIRDFAAQYPFAILPVGSTEQHGAHLPLDTDNLIAERMALETGRRSVGLVLPTMPIGYAWVWRDVPGTLTLRFDTYMRFVRDIAESLERWGIKAVFLISGHGSNPQPIKHAVRELIHEQLGIRVLYDVYAGLDRMLAEADSKRWHTEIHAEEIETSLMLAIAPELVRMDLAEADYPPVPSDYAKSELSMGHIMRSGVFGDPRPATAEKGHRWIEYAAERSAALWLEYLARHGLYQED